MARTSGSRDGSQVGRVRRLLHSVTRLAYFVTRCVCSGFDRAAEPFTYSLGSHLRGQVDEHGFASCPVCVEKIDPHCSQTGRIFHLNCGHLIPEDCLEMLEREFAEKGLQLVCPVEGCAAPMVSFTDVSRDMRKLREPHRIMEKHAKERKVREVVEKRINLVHEEEFHAGLRRAQRSISRSSAPRPGRASANRSGNRPTLPQVPVTTTRPALSRRGHAGRHNRPDGSGIDAAAQAT